LKNKKLFEIIKNSFTFAFLEVPFYDETLEKLNEKIKN